ncbi:hypothetical protein [Methanoplanus endosymbiosus]|uniref:Uncharacterized protein n=1 Tax=Methanoplanus endosymbiosus TaxID=33865 RepID=A0A9E7PQR5_9EURY|nr:hypothetical protein [Methanoplanus endosymbiosus]UUX93234.1 hypothetical protein L6E24_03675 [Methanoplanus endosymbiosus]
MRNRFQNIIVLLLLSAAIVPAASAAFQVVPWVEPTPEPTPVEEEPLPIIPALMLIGGISLIGYFFILPKYEANQRKKAFEKIRAESARLRDI